MGVASGKNGNATDKQRMPFFKRLASLLRVMDAWRLLISLIFALWVYKIVANYGRNGKYSAWRTIEVPVEIRSENAANGRIYLLDQTHRVEVEFSVEVLHYKESFVPEEFGLRIDLNRLQAAMGEYPPTLKNTEPLMVPYTFSSNDVYKKPLGVTIRSIRNGEKKILCDRIQGRQIPVVMNVDRSRQLPSWTYECVSKTPVVTVSGPAFEVNKIENIQGRISPDPKRTQQYSERVELELPHALSSVLFLDQPFVECTVTPQRNGHEELSRAFNNLRVSFLSRLDCQLHPKIRGGTDATLVSVHLRGVGKVIETISPEQLRVVCDLTPYTLAGGQHVKLTVTGLPDGVVVERIEPQDVLEVELVSEQTYISIEKSVAPAEGINGNE